MKLRHLGWTLLTFIVLAAVCAGVLVAMNLRGEDPLPEQAQAFEATPQQVERGRYLALAGNCAGCHTTRGGQPYAGGLPLETPFGTIYSSNLTSDAKAGIGSWSSAHFWRAMHNGRSKDGRLLYPAFPYPNFTKVTREDSDAIYAYLRTVAPAPAPNLAHRLRFPYDTQAALAVWRALSFKPEAFVANAGKPAEWNRGAYLVDGLGHCIACHGTRNSLGATETRLGLSGGLIAVENWYAPSLTDKHQAGVAGWPTADVVALLKTGTAPGGSVMGPMAAVVFRSTQHLSEADLTAMAGYLKDLPEVPKSDEPARSPTPIRRDAGTMARGGKIYDQRCAYCHGDQGQGATGAYPPLAGNRAVNMSTPTNLIQVVSHGGFLPSTAGNPRPYGMPPFGQVLDAAEVAAVLTYIRGSWGNDSAPVTQLDTMRR
ncbi:mono/diheme cytochrome c family protein [Variovorax boronicumulans]|uniref:c-type cytochrome n=1 Tax=Variovorax boronicumulans TaxID=436515 RepID=UPI00277E6D51|nr:cytochrome c [Variovorax boronicumulans]MDP9992516.1 mono/diheme cytochrome c family protein [Variovorax boronicumulans]MDQ0002312.1 mono/diheme cytochrome c family protein [Variovorax boronicumulans]